MRFLVALIFCISLLNLVFTKSINLYIKFDSNRNLPTVGKFVCLRGHFQWCSDYLYVDYKENLNNLNLTRILNDKTVYEFVYNFSFFVSKIDINKVFINSFEYTNKEIIKIKFQQHFLFRIINFFITSIILFFILLISIPNFNYLPFFTYALKKLNR